MNMKLRLAVLAFALLRASASISAAQSPYPEVTLDYRPMFDAACAEATKQPVAPEAVKELQSRLDTLREFWRKDAPHLLSAVPAVTGVPFRFREARASLFVCSGFPSMSLPLMINMRPYLSATAKGPVTPLVDFSNNVLHETLHRYVSDCLDVLPGRTTPLLEKYKGEPPAVRNHLHLYAIMLAVYRRLGREKDLEIVWAAEQKFPKAWAVSQRAREVVTKEGAESFVRELGGGNAPNNGINRTHPQQAFRSRSSVLAGYAVD